MDIGELSIDQRQTRSVQAKLIWAIETCIIQREKERDDDW
jgi:hypothetical protein